MDSENEQSYHQVKTRRFVLDNKHKCQIKRNHSSTFVSCFRHFVSEALQALPNIEWKRGQSF